jgi:hypothetical protein
MKAEDLAAKIILITSKEDADHDQEEKKSDKEEGCQIERIPKSMKDVYQILTFLWAVANGLARAISLNDAALPEDADDTFDEIVEKAKLIARAGGLPEVSKAGNTGGRSPEKARSQEHNSPPEWLLGKYAGRAELGRSTDSSGSDNHRGRRSCR